MRNHGIILSLGLFLLFSPLLSKQNPKPKGKEYQTTTYRVTKGDSWYGIARKMKVSPESLAKLNGRTIHENLYENEKLRIPNGNESKSLTQETKLTERFLFPLTQREKVQKNSRNSPTILIREYNSNGGILLW